MEGAILGLHVAVPSNVLWTNGLLRHPMDLGNANGFVDSIMGAVNNAIVAADLDPALLSETTLNLGAVSESFCGLCSYDMVSEVWDFYTIECMFEEESCTWKKRVLGELLLSFFI